MSETLLRFAAFGGLLLALLAAERLLPRRGGDFRWRLRWTSNLGLAAFDLLLLRLLLPVAAVGTAVWAAARGYGLLPRLPLPVPLPGVLAFLALDGLIYWQHRLMHAVSPLWRLHRVHHSDIAFDATTALRFHPLEILLSMLIKMGAVVALGAPPLAVLAFEIALNGCAMFNHANLGFPVALDRALRTLLVTPDMHRVHHSVHRDETDSNFGFCLPWWDRLFRSYRDQPRDGHEAMQIGLPLFRDSSEQRLHRLLLQPFARVV